MMKQAAKEGARSETTGKGSAPSITLPKGGGAIRGIGEKFSANPVTGTASMSIPVFTTAGRSDFYPKLSLSYDSGSGNGPMGLGWKLSVPSISRKTDKGLPLYKDPEDSDTFLLSSEEDLAPSFIKAGEEWKRDTLDSEDGEYTIQRYRPRVEGLFARIERWQKKNTGDVHWRSVTRDNITSIYGKDPNARIFDPANSDRVFQWLLEESFDDRGNVIQYQYKSEDSANVRSTPQERNRIAGGLSYSNRYLKRIFYGNRKPFDRSEWLFEVVFDYGEHDLLRPEPAEIQEWPVRPDPFSTYRACFEIRTYRLCRRILMFHHFAELGATPCLVHSTDLQYNDADPEQGPVACYLTSMTQAGYIREPVTGHYQKQTYPPLEFTYTERALHEEVRTADAEGLQNLPVGLDDSQYQLIDLNNEGISGVLTEQADAWHYKRNLSNLAVDITQAIPLPPSLVDQNSETIRFAPVLLASTKPSAAIKGGMQQFMDLAGDGQIDLVHMAEPMPGFYERGSEDEWKSFIPFESVPHIDWNSPNLKMIDLTGDGHPDILIAEDEVFVWYPSHGEQGFGPAHAVRKPQDEEQGPAVVFADPAQSIHFADMSGDGLADIVRIRNGEICYWPNLGRGVFGAKVTMDAAPEFDYAEHFDPARLRLADIDGSGTTDILYIGRDRLTLWFNQSGNSWSQAHHLSSFPAIDDLSTVSVLDLLANGTACIVWSSPLPSAEAEPMKYVDLMGGMKPHLLKSIRNNLGSETRLHYAPSSRFYLEDAALGRPWITRLPFPVQTVDRVETYDYISKIKLVTLFRYHHGYYDPVEREFRGFGMVEQWDTEYFPEFQESGLFNEETANAVEESHVPPVYTKTWFHTGVFFDRKNILNEFAAEYYREPQASEEEFQSSLLPLPAFLSEWTAEEEREACRALKGSVLRQEIYGLDGSTEWMHPYSVTQYAYQVKQLQPRKVREAAVFYPYQCENLVFHYERNPEDPRIGHTILLEVDDFGNSTKAVAVNYPRRAPQFPQQEKTIVTYTESTVANRDKEMGWYRIGIPVETRTYELTGFAPSGGVFFSSGDFIKPDQFPVELQFDREISYEQKETDGREIRLIEHVRSLYLSDDLSGPLALGDVNSLSIPYDAYKLAFTPGLLSTVYGNRVDESLLKNDGKYIPSADYKLKQLFPVTDPDDFWWVPSGRSFYSPDPQNPDSQFALDHFYLPQGFIDAFENLFKVTYDKYDLFIEETRDSLQNVVQAKNHYRMMLPWMVIDINGNRSAVRLDALGMVIASAVMGKEDQNEGDHLDLSTAEPSSADDPTTRMEYEISNWLLNGKPNFIRTFAREKHGPENPRWQETYTYSDGLGRVVGTKVQAEAGIAPKRDSAGNLVHDQNGDLVWEHTDSRWLGTGQTVFNNKGNPIRKYEPFFDSSPVYAIEEELAQWGVATVLQYDPLTRLIRTDFPNQTFSKMEFDPWLQASWDENDSVLESAWYADRKDGQMGESEKSAALKAAAHANTPVTVHYDPPGRTFLTIADNASDGQYATSIELDVEGNLKSMTDALGRKVKISSYDILGNLIYEKNMDTGERWLFPDASGKPIMIWNSRGFQFRHQYDALQRPTHLFVRHNSDPWILAERTIFGEIHPDSQPPSAGVLNLRGNVYRHYDAAGVVINEHYDFKGNLRSTTRQIAVEYKSQIDWSPIEPLIPVSPPDELDLNLLSAAAGQMLQSEEFKSYVTYDALNRPLSLMTPDQSVIRPVYNEANLLRKMEVQLRGEEENGEPVWTSFVQEIQYNERGQRKFIEYGNGATTQYSYDPNTFRLTRLETKRDESFLEEEKTVQDLHFTYDPVGNITELLDEAQQTIYFSNAVIEADAQYRYDAIYRLTGAEGREHIGQQSQPQTTWNDEFRILLAHPHDGNAMRRYVQQYTYDPVGNILNMTHQLGTLELPGQVLWTRDFGYIETSLVNPIHKNNRLSGTIVQPNSNDPIIETYPHDEHGNITGMPHLSLVRWNCKDQLEASSKQFVGNGGTPETTYYVYDASGHRVRKVTERHAPPGQTPARLKETIYLDTFEIYREYDGNGSSIAFERQTLHIMDDSRRIALAEIVTQGGEGPSFSSTRYQFVNHLQSACLELDENAEIISYEEYHPYGTSAFQSGRSQAEVSLKKYRYTGKERDEETGFYYYGARYYAPWLARWTIPDPAGTVDSINLYSYVRNNPVILLDVVGLQGSKSQIEQAQRRLEQAARSIIRSLFSLLKQREVYKNLDQKSRSNVDKIIQLANKEKDPRKALYYAEKLKLLFDTPHDPKKGRDLYQEMKQSEKEARERMKTKEGLRHRLDEENKTKDPSRNWTVVKNAEYGVEYRVDRSDPDNIHVHLKVKVSTHWVFDEKTDKWVSKGVNYPNAAKVLALEDDAEKIVSATKGYTLDIEFVHHSGKDVFDVGVDPDQWASIYNWVGPAITIAHEAQHVLGLDDRYNIIEHHAGNPKLTVEDRIAGFLYQMEKTPHVEGEKPGLMGPRPKEETFLFNSEVCAVAYPGDAALQRTCIDARVRP